LIDLRKYSALLIALVLLPAAFGEGTHTWEQSKFEDLVKGTAKGVALRSTGGIQLAPAFKQLYTSPSTYIWSIAADPAGNLYAAAGAPARLYRIGVDGQISTILEPQELQIQALVVDKNGAIYAATSPDGKVYKVEQKKITPVKGEKPSTPPAPEWNSEVYFDPGTKYIWDLVLDDSGNLYVATGDHGEIFKVLPDGEHSVFFKSDEAHIRALIMDHKGNLIAGSDGSGLVYRISPAGDAFVLYSAPKKEITALAIDDAGNIYAAGAGEKHAGLAQALGTATMVVPAPAAAQGPMGTAAPTTPPAPGPGTVSLPAPRVGAAGGSEIYKIAPDGSPLRLWHSQDDLVYALSFDEHGTLLAGTGNRGHIFAITGEDEFVDLLKVAATQVTAFAKAPGGGLYASTSNLGKLFLIGPGLAEEGTYDSDVFDARNFSKWGRAEFRGAGNVHLFARSGNVDNPDRNWSPWTPIDLQKNPVLVVPAARFVQWRAVLRTGSSAPELDSLLLNYLPKNVAPQIDDVSVQPGMRYPQLPKPPNTDPAPPPPTPVRDRDSIAVKWTAHDDNDDQMVYSVYYRGDGETRWLLLKEDVTDKFYSFDAGLLPDGGYTIQVVVSDKPSHSPGEALSTEKQSSRFEVDTTPPRIDNLAASFDAGGLRIVFRAVDSFSPIKRAEYSLDAGDWQYIEPVDQISDSKSESYDFRLPLQNPETAEPAPPPTGRSARKPAAPPPSRPPTDHVVVVRAYDRFDNMGAMKLLVRGR
jgi:sugar lactone lactonase YvrE